MRRNARRRSEIKKWWEDKRIILSGSVISLALAIILGVALYSSDDRFNDDNNAGVEKSQTISLAPETEINNETKSASTTVGKSVEQIQNENNKSDNTTEKATNTVIDNSAKTDKTNTSKTISSNKDNTTNSTKSSVTKKQDKQVSAPAKSDKKIELAWPVKGDILKAFSADNLLYSSTLQEWTVHNGIDIKADKASVVSAAADGTIKAIKNDPRYGLTVIIEHENGLKTVYSNLLTSEFVVEGEKVKQGQTIGTIGNSANFEVVDDSHLHFELLKDNEYVDPMLYLN